MNDISVKVVETPNELASKSATTLTSKSATAEDPVVQNEVDPLAIQEVKVEKDRDPLKIEDENQVEKVKVGNCDENNAKEGPLSKAAEVSDETLASLTEKIKEELIKEDDSPISSVPDDNHEVVDVKDDKKEIPVKDIELKTEEVKIKDSSPLDVPVETAVVLEPIKPVEVEIPEIKEVAKLVDSVDKLTTVPAEKVKDIEEVKSAVEIKDSVEDQKMDVMNEVKEDKTEKKDAVQNELKPVNGDCSKEESSKRRASVEAESESPLKKLCHEIEKTYPNHDAMITDYIQKSTKNNVDEIQRHTEQLLSEIQTLRELAQKKEHEWNNILHLKKVKEEILLRLLRQKQVLGFEKASDVNGTDRAESFDTLNQPKNYAIDKNDEISGVAIKPLPITISVPPNPPITIQAPVMPVSSHYTPMTVLPPPYDKAAHMHNVQKNMFPTPLMLPGPTLPGFPRDMNGQLTNNYGLPMGRQGPTKDVKSIIADYRQRNPDVTPRRGRRMKSILNPNMMNPPPRPIAPKLDGMSNLSNLGMMFNNFDMNQKAMLERLSQMQTTNLPNGLSFKDVLVQFANMQQQPNPNLLIRPDMMPNRPPEHHQARGVGRRAEKSSPSLNDGDMHISLKQCDRHATASPRLPPPPPYPEISLLPVTSSQEQTSISQQNSLLHGILTKQGSPASHSYSPTLAKLLTSPERKQNTPTLPSYGQAKSCGEITITPVQPAPLATLAPSMDPVPEKTEDVVQLDEEDSVASDGDGSASAEGDERRLVIDEGAAGAGAGGAGGGAPGEDTPLCQGCRRRDALFVCAGCANQWYCSRDCQVAAWDDHSEMCSG